MKHKNKLLALAAAGVLTVTGMTMPAVQAASDDMYDMYGDLDGDGAVTISDAYRTLRAYSRVSAGGDSGLTDIQQNAADVNRDGFVTIEDAYYILKYYAEHFAGNQVTWEEVTRETVVVASELYQEYYEPFLRNIKYKISDALGSYYFADLNHDGIKELIIPRCTYAYDSSANVYTISGNRVVYAGTAGDAYATYYCKNGIYYGYFIKGGNRIIRKITMNQTTVTTTVVTQEYGPGEQEAKWMQEIKDLEEQCGLPTYKLDDFSPFYE